MSNSSNNQNNLNETLSRIESELIQMKVNNYRRTASNAKLKNFKNKDDDSEINSFQNISLGNGNGSKSKRMLKLNKNKSNGSNESDDESDQNTRKKSSNGNTTHYNDDNISSQNGFKGININQCFNDLG